MKETEINKAIALFCGRPVPCDGPHEFKFVPLPKSMPPVDSHYSCVKCRAYYWLSRPHDIQWPEDYQIPDYCNDLNAIHTAENKLLTGASRTIKEQWEMNLRRAATLGATSAECATARQRCEALLRTLNLWKD